MRDLINIILNEVTLSRYSPGQQFLISGTATGQKYKAILAAQGIESDGIITLTTTQANTGPVIELGGKGDPVTYSFQNQQGQIWTVTGSANQIEAPLVHYKGNEGDEDQGKVANRGEIAEGILGAAMFAKFVKRQGNEEIGQVAQSDIENILDSLQQTGKDTYQVAVNDADNEYADTVTFLLKLKTAPYRDLMDPAKRSLLTKEFASAAAYVNSSMAERYSKYFYLNGRADDIAVIADGAASETEKKTDVWVAIKDKNGRMRQLRLNASLKTGGQKQFGQVGGSSVESMQKLWSYFDISIGDDIIASYQRMTDPTKALGFMYQQISKILNLKFSDPTQEVKFINQLAHAITYFATLGDPNVELVDFDQGGFKILRFKNLEHKLRTVQLTARYISNKAAPEIAIHEEGNPKNVLVGIRAKREKTKKGDYYFRNYIEKGPLLEQLTKVEYKKTSDVELPDPEKSRVQIKHPGRKAVPRDKDTTPRQKRDK